MSLFDDLRSIEDVNRLLIAAGMREGETLDYKHLMNWAPDSADEVAKDASAFANAAGGLLVYGVATRKDGDSTLPERVVGLDPALIAKVQRAISDLVRHPIPGVRTKSLPEGGVPSVFLVDIPPSPLAPHQQTRTRAYYRRDGDQNKPMPHDLVELYFGRRLGPVLVPSVARPTPVEGSGDGIEHEYYAAIHLENIGAGSARDVLLVIAEPETGPAGLREVRGLRGGRVFPSRDGHGVMVQRIAGDATVVHPTDVISAASIRFRAARHRGYHGIEIARLRLFADRMAPSEWSLRVAVGGMGFDLALVVERVGAGGEGTE